MSELTFPIIFMLVVVIAEGIVISKIQKVLAAGCSHDVSRPNLVF